MESKAREILVEVTKNHTIEKMENLLKMADNQYNDYSDELAKAEGNKYESDVVNGVEQADADSPLHERLDDLEEILKNLNSVFDINKVEENLKRAYKEFSNGFCDRCVDYLNREELKEKLAASLSEEYSDQAKMNKIIEEWINHLIE